jgi:phosphatidylglycerophosphate synthase
VLSIESSLFLWLPLIAVVLHLIEEFVFPGGFGAWYRRYRPDLAPSITTRLLVIVNAVLVVLALIPPLLGHTPRGYAFWSVVVALGLINALFHIWAVVRTDEYSPGFITGLIVYIPLFVLGILALKDYHKLALGTIIEAIVIALAYHFWSDWNHRRRARKAGAAA